MSKLLHFKEWLTIKEATKCLTKVFDEKVKVRDIYRLALDKKLVLSLHFINSTYVELGVGVDNLFNISNVINDTPLLFNKRYKRIKAGTCCDLVNLFGGRQVIRQGYYSNTCSKLKIEPELNKEIIITDIKNCQSCYYRLINYLELDGKLSQVVAANHLPEDVLVVVKTKYLNEFISTTNAPNNQVKPLHNKERTSLYKVIALLAEMNQLSPSKEFKTANIIKTYGDSIGFDCPSSHTIAKYLKEASHYLPVH